MSGNFYTFAAIRGVQAGCEYYVIMVPLKLVSKIFEFDNEQLPADLRAQRVLSKVRVPQIASYLANNFEEYTLSSLCASIDGLTEFTPASESKEFRNVGTLSFAMDGRIILNDGQHRRAAIEEALKTRPALENEAISVVVFPDRGLERSQQMFADLNKNALRPSSSLNVLYDRRDPLSRLSIAVLEGVEFYRNFVELEKTSFSNRAKNLITLSSLNQANKWLAGPDADRFGRDTETIVVGFWRKLVSVIPDWQKLEAGRVSSSDLRKETVHAHGVMVQALGLLGSRLIAAEPEKWEGRLEALSTIDWSKRNATIWQGRVMRDNKIDASQRSIHLSANVLIKAVGLDLDDKQQDLEDEFEETADEHRDAVGAKR